MSTFSKDKIAEVLNQITSNGNGFMNDDPGSREKLLASARELIVAAESPVESLLWSIWAQPTRTVAARIAVDLKIFETAVQDSGRPKTDSELAASTGASPKLVQRIARTCVSMRMLDEKGPGLYVPNALTHVLCQPEYAAGIVFCFDCANISFSKLPSYLRNTKFQNPEDAVQGPFQFGHDWSGHAFDWLTKHPEVFQAFHGYVYALRKHRPAWSEMYPVKERLIDGLKMDGDSSVFVDVGGGTGQILEDFHASVPEYAGRLVLQEVPEVINAAVASGSKVARDSRFELQTHDFFTRQPVRGARAYFMRSVLHDWQDEKCRVILSHLKDAMEPGYSRILISDCVVANEHAAWQHASLDIFMMALASSQERTENEWYKLIESCGLKIAGIFQQGEGNE
ncbi:hypothetical protein diail_7078, partial [Diaporthe ilicicola]